MAILEQNYKGEHDIRSVTTSRHTFTSFLEKPGNNFQLFIPPGTIYLSVLIHVGRDDEIGVAARLGLPPEGSYNMKANYWTLPWKSPNDPYSLADFRTREVQRKNRGGTIKVVEKQLQSPEPSPGEYLYFKVLSYDGSIIPSLTYTVSVDTKKYNAWFKTDPFNAQGQPSGKTGKKGESIEAAWSEEGRPDEVKHAEKPKKEEDCKPENIFKCMKYGPSYRPTWNKEKKICECVGKGHKVLKLPLEPEKGFDFAHPPEIEVPDDVTRIEIEAEGAVNYGIYFSSGLDEIDGTALALLKEKGYFFVLGENNKANGFRIKKS